MNVFDKYAEDYDRWYDSLKGQELFRVEVEAAKLLMKGLEHPFLEIGAGTGRFSAALGIDLGVDPSAKALAITERRGVRILQAEGERLPLEDESFGAVFVLFSLCFVRDPPAVLSEAKRVLKRNGALTVGIINQGSPWGTLYENKKAEGHPLYSHARFYRVDEVKKMMVNAGLGIEAYSSTLCRPPAESHGDETAFDRLVEDAGFVCMRARRL